MSETDPLKSVPVLHFVNGQTVVEWRDFGTLGDKIAHVTDLAHGPEGVRDRVVRAISADIRSRARTTRHALELAHEMRARAIAYVPEGQEILETPRNVLSDGFRYSDCEGHAALGLALAIALGGRGWIVTMGGTPEDAVHATLIVTDDANAKPPRAWYPLEEIRSAPTGCYWSDTSVQSRRARLVGNAAEYRVARFNEHPYAAAMRLDTLEEQGTAF